MRDPRPGHRTDIRTSLGPPDTLQLAGAGRLVLLPTNEAISEHTAYFPAIGLFAACSYIALRIWVKYGRIFGNVERTVRVGIVLVIVTPLLFLTLNRNLVWQNEFSLWKDAVIKSPNKDRPHMNLGLAYFNAGRFDEAISEYMTALSINPNEAKVMNNLGLVYVTVGKSMSHRNNRNK